MENKTEQSTSTTMPTPAKTDTKETGESETGSGDVNHNQRSPSPPQSNSNGSISIEIPKKNNKINISRGPSSSSSLGFDFVFFRRFIKIHRYLFRTFRSLSTLFLVMLIGFCVLGEYVVFHVGSIPSKFYKVLGDKDLPGFWKVSLISIGIIVGVSWVKSTIQYCQKLLTAVWRKNLTLALHQMYFRDINYYLLNVLDNVIDNPDQRMTQDVDKFTTTYCDILPKIFMAPFVIAYYSYKAYITVGWPGPTACFVFFILSATVNKILMGPVVRQVMKQEQREGDLRFFHMLVRVNSEPIAFNHGSELETSNTNESLQNLITTQRSLYLRQYFLNIAVKLFDYLASIISYFAIALPIFTGIYDDLKASDLSALISQNSFVNMYLIYQFTQLVDLSGKFTDVVGVTHRIAELIERLQILQASRQGLGHDKPIDTDIKHAKTEGSDPDTDMGRGQGQGEALLSIQNLTFSAPGRIDPLIRDLTLTIYTGESVLVVGESSQGKSSLLRIIRGLWLPKLGTVDQLISSDSDKILYCPQKTYLTCGSLRDQVCFPSKPTKKDNSSVEDNLLVSLMASIHLQDVLARVGGLDVPVPWSVYESFSPGEMQRLCLLRVLYRKPLIAILDEATSALTEEMENWIYKELHRLNVTVLSIGHRKSLRKFHPKILVLEKFGRWQLCESNEYKVENSSI